MDRRQAIRLVISIIVTQGAAVLGALATGPAIGGWYESVRKPAFNPPNWLFAPVWTVLYLLMGVSLFLVWRRAAGNPAAKPAMAFFAAQLALNVAWSFIFFAFQAPGWAFLEIIVLWAAIVLTVVFFFRVSRPAGYLLLPYLAWVTFAAVLNWAIWRLNM